jgi:hypothetical protein
MKVCGIHMALSAWYTSCSGVTPVRAQQLEGCEGCDPRAADGALPAPPYYTHRWEDVAPENRVREGVVGQRRGLHTGNQPVFEGHLLRGARERVLRALGIVRLVPLGAVGLHEHLRSRWSER